MPFSISILLGAVQMIQIRARSRRRPSALRPRSPRAFIASSMALFSLLLMLPAGASSAAAPQDLQSSCNAAKALTAANHPQMALDLIDKIRGPLDLQVKTPSTACEPERLDAVAALGAVQLKDQTKADGIAAKEEPATGLPASWDAFVKSWIIPLQNAFLVWLGLVAAFLILARLSTFIPGMPLARLPWKEHSVQLGRYFLFGGLFLILTTPAAMISTLSRIREGTPTPSASVASLAILLGLGLAGALAVGLWMSSRLRVAIEARNGKDAVSEAATNRMVALLNELGSTRPRGLEIPRGTDVTALTDSLAAASSGNKIVTALRAIVQIIFSATPWRVSITEGPKDHLAVSITRNGRAVGAATIARDNTDLFPEPGPPPGGPDLHLDKIAAAFVLSTIAKHHQGFEGLCGATDWRSVGQQFIATTDCSSNAEYSCRLLASAMELDPKNLLAEVALQNKMHRRSTDRRELESYAKWLWDKQSKLGQPAPGATTPGPEVGSLLLRLRFTYLCVIINLASMSAGFSIGAEPRAAARELMRSLKKPSPGCESLALQMQPRAAVLCQAFDCAVTEDRDFTDWQNAALESPAPHSAYSAACHYAREAQRLEGSARVWAAEKAKERLRYSFVEPDLKAWASDDPELRRLADLDSDFRDFLDRSARREVQSRASALIFYI